MANIHWAKGVSGKWATAADWAGGLLPGGTDTAYIDASGVYTVTAAANVAVAGVVLDDAGARLQVDKAMTAQLFQLEAGTLELKNGSLSGTVSQTGGTFAMTNGTLNNVTWEGALYPVRPSAHVLLGTLTILNGLTLTGAGGSGAGTLTVAAGYGSGLVLNNVASLDNAGISLGVIASVINTGTLTLGTGLSVTGGGVAIASGDTVINDGALNNVNVFGGTFTNNGVMQGGNILPAVFTNNGTITESAKQTLILNTDGLQAAGASAKIILDSGDLGLSGHLTTAQLLAMFGAQHISTSGNHGFGLVSGALDNTGATLDIGKGTVLGEMSVPLSYYDSYSFVPGTITGGTIVEHDTGSAVIGGGQGGTFSSLTINSHAKTLTLNSIVMNNVDIGGASTIDVLQDFNGQYNTTLNGGTLSGVGTINDVAGLWLNGVDVTGVGGDGQVTVNAGMLGLGTGQATAGYTFNLTASTIYLGNTETINNATINLSSSFVTFAVAAGQSGTLAAGSVFDIGGAGNGLGFVGGGSGSLVNDANIDMSGVLSIGIYQPGSGGTLTNNGTIAIANGSLVTSVFDGHLVNHGVISVAGGLLELKPSDGVGDISVTNGTLLLDGALTVASLSEVATTNSQEWIAGTLNLGGQTITLGEGGVPVFSLANDWAYAPVITDGAIVINSGTTMDWTGLAGTIGVALVNDGVVAISPDEAGYAGTYSLTGSISGNGTMSIGDTAAVTNVLIMDAGIGRKQTIQFIGSAHEELDLATRAAATGCAATLAGFAVGDSIVFGNENIVSGGFVGDSIVAALAGGGTITVATAGALTGTLTATESNGSGTLVYSSAAALAHGQNGNGAAAVPVDERAFAHLGDPAQGGAGWFGAAHVF